MAKDAVKTNERTEVLDECMDAEFEGKIHPEQQTGLLPTGSISLEGDRIMSCAFGLAFRSGEDERGKMEILPQGSTPTK
ncbi:MAG: hypothetical protein K8H89_10000 [Flavobacteriales bacterium]|jgi:hypothetical protein|nr:hypothetical protein [Flavobacteriales bacterium]MCB0759124.1 hypothetical protein [Flavobacteriales bacterium]